MCLVETAFRNLRKNTLHHNDKAVPEVTVSVTADDGTVRVRIADTGPGIPVSVRSVLFERGQRRNTVTGPG
jgi:signal transduction histidine kinase